MSRSRVFLALLDGLACAGLLLVLAFPAVTSMAALGQGLAGGAGPSLVVGGPLQGVRYVLAHSDSGGQMEAGAGLLRGTVFLAGALWLLRPRRPDRRLRPLYLVGAAFLALVLASALTGAQLRDSLAAWGDYLAMALAFAVAADLAAEYRHLPVLHLAGLALAVAVTLVLPAAWFLFAVNPDPNAAMFGGFYQANMLAGYLLLGVPLATLALVSSRGPRDADRPAGVLGGLLLAALAVSLYDTYSRAAWAFGLLALLLPLALLPRLGGRDALARVGGALATFLLAAGAAARLVVGAPAQGALLAFLAAACAARLFWTLPGARRRLGLALLVLVAGLGLAWALSKGEGVVNPHVVRRAGELATGQDSSGAARLEFYRAAVRMAVQHPGLGVGPEGFHRHYPALQGDLRWFAKYTHSLTMTLLAETGPPSALLFYGAVVLAGVVWWRRAAADEGPGDLPLESRTVRLGLGLGVLVFLGHAQFDVDFHFLALPLLAAMLAGVAVGTPSSTEPPAEDGEDSEPRSEWSLRPSMAVQYLGSALLLALVTLNAVGGMGDLLGAQARTATERGLEDLALESYRQAARWDPLQGEHQRQASLLLLDRVAAARGASEAARELDERSARAVALDPWRAVSQSTRGRALEVLGRPEEAVPFYRRALELDPVNYPSFYLDVARVQAQKGDVEGARALLLAALPRFPEEAAGQMFSFRRTALQEQLSDVYLNLALMTRPGSPDRMAWLEKSAALNPTSRASRFALAAERYERARGLEAGGREEPARALFQEVGRTFRELYAEDPGYPPLGEFLRDLKRRGY